MIGVPDETWGEAVTAVVVLRPDSADSEAARSAVADEIRARVKEAKGAVQAPKAVIFAEALPLTALGKPDKKALRAQFS